MQVIITHAQAEEIVDGVWGVVASDAEGRSYTHEHHFEGLRAFDRALQMAIKVRGAGRINADHWDCYVPYGSEAWLIDDMEVTMMDDEERYYRGI